MGRKDGELLWLNPIVKISKGVEVVGPRLHELGHASTVYREAALGGLSVGPGAPCS